MPRAQGVTLQTVKHVQLSGNRQRASVTDKSWHKVLSQKRQDLSCAALRIWQIAAAPSGARSTLKPLFALRKEKALKLAG